MSRKRIFKIKPLGTRDWSNYYNETLDSLKHGEVTIKKSSIYPDKGLRPSKNLRSKVKDLVESSTYGET